MMQCEIIYEDSQVIVVRKPAGLATQTAKIGQADVVSELKNYGSRKSQGKSFPERQGRKEPPQGKQGERKRKQDSRQGGFQPYIGVVHRLDQPVEGLLVFAKIALHRKERVFWHFKKRVIGHKYIIKDFLPILFLIFHGIP